MGQPRPRAGRATPTPSAQIIARAGYDYFHLNSLAGGPADGNLIVSGRNVWAGYELDRRSGAVVWTLGGRHSSFTISRPISSPCSTRSGCARRAR